MDNAESCVFRELLQINCNEYEDTIKRPEDLNACSTFELSHNPIKVVNTDIYTNVSFGPSDRLLSECNVSIECVPSCFNMNNFIDSDTTSSGIESLFDNVGENEMSATLLNYDCDDLILDYSPANLELDLSFLEDIMRGSGGEYAKCIPPLTLNRERQKNLPLAQKVLPWERKKKKIFTQKKLPVRKCSSSYINKLNRITDEEHEYSNSVFANSKSNSGFTEEKKYNSNKNDLECSSNLDSSIRRRDRPSQSKSSASNEKHKEEKSYKPSLRYLKMLQDSNAALKELNGMLCRTVKTRAEAFQMLSNVQSITKTLKMHLDTAIRSSRCNKRNKQSLYKFLLNYLTEQIKKSEELTRLLDDAITEADRTILFQTNN